jgi:starch synthase
MFNLAPEHYFGFRDPHRGDLLNFTIAASEHATGGVVTVSRPYARQIASPGGGDGLENVLTRRTKSVFGVSNGIDRAQIDAYLSMISGESTELLRQPTTLLAAKNRAKESIQARYGLSLEPNATLVSFVGRLAEQKGLHLLSGFVNGSDQSTLESIVSSNHDTQILVAGPLTSGDSSSDAIRNTLDYLRVKYPGRVAAIFDYIPHATALEMMFASTLFLMPSRFEPGGITQLEALAAGTLVVGRNVGGISATIENFNPVTGSGNGFLCNDYCPTAFANTTRWALSVIRDQKMRARLVSQAIHAPHSWADRVPTFVAVLQRIILGAERFQNLSALHESRARVSTASV